MEIRSKSLFTWVASLPLFENKKKVPKPQDFQDGILISTILKEEIDPIYFEGLISSPKNSTPLVKVLDKMKEYFIQQAELSAPIPSKLLPNPARIIQSGDINEITRLLQLLLGCAVNSPHQEDFIRKIQAMCSRDQEVIMEAIQEYIIKESSPSARQDDISEIIQLQNDMRVVSEAKEQLAQKCHDLNSKLSAMLEEKAVLLTENEKLSAQLEFINNDPESIPPIRRENENESRREIERLREENFKLEAQVDDFKLKVDVMEKLIQEANSKNASVSSLEAEIRVLKDKNDYLNEAESKSKTYEGQIQIYKKKLEELSVIKRNKKELEGQLESVLKEKISIEEKSKFTGNWKSQIDGLKKNLTEAEQLVSQEKQKALKAEFDLRNSREQLQASQEQIQRLIEEKARLKLENMEQGSNLPEGVPNRMDEELNIGDNLPTHIREKLVRLELQNKNLLEQMESVQVSDPSNTNNDIVVNILRKKEKELNETLLSRNHELNELRNCNKLDNDKILMLQAQLQAKEEEIRKKDNQYKKCMDKAKDVIINLQPTAVNDFDTKFDAEIERARAVREMEEKLLASAFYNMGVSLHRNSVENRNTLLSKCRQNAVRRRSDM